MDAEETTAVEGVIAGLVRDKELLIADRDLWRTRCESAQPPMEDARILLDAVLELNSVETDSTGLGASIRSTLRAIDAWQKEVRGGK